MKSKLICLLGPTAVGKTEISIQLAQRLNAEIVSVDSRQIYRQVDIGTAKPTPEEQQAAPHYLIDCVDITQPFSVADYQALADEAIVEIQDRGKQVLLVGGAGLYFRSIVDGLFEGPAADPSFRKRLEQEALQQGADTLHNRLRACDPESAERIHPNNLTRVIRALEVYELTGTPMSEHQQQWKHGNQRYPFIAFGLTMPREILYRRIEQRVDIMLANGLIAEVESLLAEGYSRDTFALQSFGYKELIAYLDGQCTYIEAIEQLKQNTRRFAKRQLTWFRKDKRIRWIDRESTPDVVGYIMEEIESARLDDIK
ncbi:tRNA (adenosine(37)-N6)-dimethylallyltransferase MiaA [Candidatus Poribacteria bacterium]|nr:tRNA (adenosine(37)-N6)-dimethylallyltransferase MiaA [Candidatus Poribacteria bacterium]MYB63885.1 tRNA (adenosine(37)-N6)-dimethylallyltransferase MiaA [Candidatus Poribacteria bacterium]MYF56752.1 tRNA (adenosine(37)-N6)-dimethylallyltransferase MiaA [Candidatus Poribacteria bacterium]MYI93857.1 tRNA (adenosine(37)-N6)-dimethylallyltransferase MiaA [Candidatus Poribacteria bacterium]